MIYYSYSGRTRNSHGLLSKNTFQATPLIMQRFIDIPRAAKLAGVSRTEIRQLITEEILVAADGKILYDDLLRLYPEIARSKGAMFEIVSQIKEDAVTKASSMHSRLKSSDIKAIRSELAQAHKDVIYYRQLSEKYKKILIELRPKLVTLQNKSEHKHRIQAIIDWFVHKTKELW